MSIYTAENVPRYTSDSFMIQGKLLSAEASDLALRAVPVRLLIESKRTGRVMPFVLEKTIKDNENDTVAWDYRATERRSVTLRIWND